MAFVLPIQSRVRRRILTGLTFSLGRTPGSQGGPRLGRWKDWTHERQKRTRSERKLRSGTNLEEGEEGEGRKDRHTD